MNHSGGKYVTLRRVRVKGLIQTRLQGRLPIDSTPSIPLSSIPMKSSKSAGTLPQQMKFEDTREGEQVKKNISKSAKGFYTLEKTSTVSSIPSVYV